MHRKFNFETAKPSLRATASLMMAMWLGLVVAPASYGADCDALVADRIQWVTAGGGNWVSLVMATHETGRNQLVSYVQGLINEGSSGLSGTPPTPSGPSKMWTSGSAGGRPRGTAQDGETAQYFSTEFRCMDAPSSNPSFCSVYTHFNPYRSDRLSVRIESKFLALSGRIVLKLLSWGGGEIVLQLEDMSCTDEGILVMVKGTSVSSITLTKGNSPIFIPSNPR